jgi:hypothetical protein
MPQSPKLAELEREATALIEKAASAQPERAEEAWWSVTDAMTISSAVLIFGLIAICITAWLLRRERNSLIILRTVATTLIITFAVFLIVAGYSDQQIAPAMGLLGTIAGYLLGKDANAETAGTAGTAN